MDVSKLMIYVIHNGNVVFLDRTLSSLKNQTVKSFCYEVIDCCKFWISDRNQHFSEAEYVLFLYGGSCLKENAVEQIYGIIDRSNPSWIYFDEETFGAQINGDQYGYMEKPDFDPLAFVQNVYTGEGVVFSRNCLNRMDLQYEGGNFAALIMEMSIAAAIQEEPEHIREILLTRHQRMPFGQKERNCMANGLKKYLQTYMGELNGVPRTDGSGLDIVPAAQKTAELSLVLLADSQGCDDLLKAEEKKVGAEIIPVIGTMPYWEKCLQGAQKASADTLCFVCADNMQDVSVDLVSLSSYTNLPHTGIVSPCLSNSEGYFYTGCYQSIGKNLFIPHDAGLMDDIRAVRQISIPAWQCWMVKRELFLRIMDTVMHTPDIGAYSKDCFMLECAAQANALGKMNLYIGTVTASGLKNETEDSHVDFCDMIYRHRDKLFMDRFCPVKFASFMRSSQRKHKRFYFPKDLPDYAPDAKNVLVLTHELSLTGAPVVLSHAVHILREEGIRIVVVSPMDGVLKNAFLKENVPVIVLDDMDECEDWLEWARDFDLVLVNTVVPFRQIVQLGKIKTPVMWWLHDAKSGYDEYLKHVLPKTLSDNVHIYSVSKYADDAMKTYRPQFQSDLLFYGLKDVRAQIEDSVCRIEGAKGRKVFVSVGTVIPRKGQDILAQAVRLLPNDVRKQCLFLFIGKCMDKRIFQEIKLLEKDYPDEVRQIDAVTHDEIFGLYRQAAAVICSSRDDPLPTFMAETMMVSGVCICSENTGTASVICDGVNGFLYRNNSPEELAVCIQRVVETNEMDMLKAEARKTFEQYFTLEIFRKNLMNCVMNCIEHKGEE